MPIIGRFSVQCDNRRARHVIPGLLPKAKTHALLYTSDAQGQVVYVFSLSSRKLVGTLSGFENPNGECVDKSGDVWITDFLLAKTVEYAHGGTVPIAELNDSVGDPIACSIDPGTGTLAIANAQNTILIHKQGERTPKVYTDANIAGFSYCAYDGLGNLFADGFSQSAARLVELVKGAREFRNIAGFDHSGSLQWDGTYLAAASIVNGQQWTQIDRLKVAGNVAKIVQTVELQNPRFPFDGQFWIQGDTIIGPTAGPRGNAQVLEAWPYPAGGAPKHAYRTHGDDYVTLEGVVVSRVASSFGKFGNSR